MTQSRLRRSVGPEDDDRKVDMSPMIDMVFLLLIFFIVNATAIVVRTDPDVEPPTATNGIQGNPDGRIVINVRADGTFTAEDLTILPNEEAIFHYVRDAHAANELDAVISRLHLRGDKEALFKHGRAAVRAAARAKVEQVLFSTYLQR